MRATPTILLRVFLWAAILLISLTVVAGCRTSRDRQVSAERYKQIERDPGGEPPTVEAEGLRNPANRVPDISEPVRLAPNPKCPGQVLTSVRSEKGNSCDTYEAEIGGWAELCVSECNPAARLAEAIASARATCAEFCKKKQCPNPVYVAPKTCATMDCPNRPECDQQVCPLKDQCYLLQKTRVFNCSCLQP